MAEVLATVTAAAGLLMTATRIAKAIHQLSSDVKHGPAIILALLNETADLTIVLSRINDARETLKRLDSNEDAAFVTALHVQLGNAREVLASLDNMLQDLSRQKRSMQRMKWSMRQGNAMILKNQLREVSHVIDECLVHRKTIGRVVCLYLTLVMPSSTISARVELEIHNVYTVVEESRAFTAEQSGAMSQLSGQIKDMRETTDGHQQTLSSEIRTIRDDTSRANLETARRLSAIEAKLAEMSIKDHDHGTGMLKSQRSGDMPHTARSQPLPTETVYFSMRPRLTKCSTACSCQCHIPSDRNVSWAVPNMLRAIVGSLFVGYAGLPINSSPCNLQSCASNPTTRLEVSYAFPLWFAKSTFQAFFQTSATGGFTFGLTPRRRMNYWPGYNILYYVQRKSFDEVKRMLTENGASIFDIDARDGSSVLHCTLANPLLDIKKVRLLLQYGADPDYEDDGGESARHLAARRIFQLDFPPDVVSALETLLPVSSCIDDLDLTRLHKVVLGILPIPLTSALQSPQYNGTSMEPPDLNAQDRSGATALHYAARRGDADSVAALLAAGARHDIGATRYATAFHWAAYAPSSSSARIIDLFLDAGAEVDRAHGTGYARRTPLMHAVQANNLTAARRLVARNASIRRRNKHEPAPLGWAVNMNRPALVEYFLREGADVEEVELGGYTPLSVAIAYNAHESLEVLLKAGANVHHVSDSGETVLHMLALWADRNTIESFSGGKLAGLDSLAKNKAGLTAWQVFERRSSVSDELRGAFLDLLR